MLTTPLKDVLATNGTFLGILEKNRITTVEDLLHNFPRVYEDRSTFTTIAKAVVGQQVTMKGTLTKLSTFRTKRGHKLLKAVFTDEEGTTCDVVWFNQQHLYRTLKEEVPMVLSGKLKLEYRKLSLMSPKHEYYTKSHNLVHFGKIVPIYSEMDRISTDWLRTKLERVRDYIPYIKESLPADIVFEKKFMPKAEAVAELHFPTSMDRLEEARRRLAFEELFFLQLKSLYKKMRYQLDSEEQSLAIPMDASFIQEFLKTLPFELTEHQKIAAFQMLQDMEEPVPMQRLLEGDVGSGKTVVATLLAVHTIVKGGAQVALMAPTEVLASQHYKHIAPMLSSWGINTQFLSGSMTKKQKEEVYRQISTQTCQFVIGTHALIQEGVQFSKLGLVIIDEQHRFGVGQRKKLADHGYPHVLHMTATPIPRTLALTMYGDQDLSIISQMPAGRKKIETKVVQPHHKKQMYLFVEDQIKKGRQVFVICPLIEESEKLENVKAVTEEFAYLEKHIFPDYNIALLHGKMGADEKERIMTDFNNKDYDILVSTSVIEVGINVPNATVMIIEGAERFGLSQLHQLRGRVGRGEHQSYCFLATEKSYKNDRLAAMEKHHDGFKLAEIDLELRGPGEVYGVKQSGIPDLKMANFQDLHTIIEAREAAKTLLEEDITLESFPRLRKIVY